MGAPQRKAACEASAAVELAHAMTQSLHRDWLTRCHNVFAGVHVSNMERALGNVGARPTWTSVGANRAVTCIWINVAIRTGAFWRAASGGRGAAARGRRGALGSCSAADEEEQVVDGFGGT